MSQVFDYTSLEECPDEVFEEDSDVLEDIPSTFDIEVDNMKIGISFRSEEEAIQSIDSWSYTALCPLMTIQVQKPKEGVKGKRCFGCQHGVKRTSKSTSKRPSQRLNYTGCSVGININQQRDGTWVGYSL